MGNRVSGPNNGDMVHGVARVSEACEKVIGARCAFTAFHRIPDTDNCGFVCPVSRISTADCKRRAAAV